MFDSGMEKGTKLFLAGAQRFFDAAVPESKPTIIDLPWLNTSGLELTLIGLQKEILVVSPTKGWGILEKGESSKFTRIADLDTDSSAMAVDFFYDYVHFWVSKIIPVGSPIDMGKIVNALGEGTRDYELFNGILKFFLMVSDGVIDEDDLALRQKAKNVLTWLANKG